MNNKILTDEEKILEIKSKLYVKTNYKGEIKLTIKSKNKIYIDDNKEDLKTLSKANFKALKPKENKPAVTFRR